MGQNPSGDFDNPFARNVAPMTLCLSDGIVLQHDTGGMSQWTPLGLMSSQIRSLSCWTNVKLSHVEYGSKYPSTPRFSRN